MMLGVKSEKNTKLGKISIFWGASDYLKGCFTWSGVRQRNGDGMVAVCGNCTDFNVHMIAVFVSELCSGV